MFGLIVFFAVFGYFVYNIVYMSKYTPIDFIDGLWMFFFQGAEDFCYWFKNTALPWLKDKLGKK